MPRLQKLNPISIQWSEKFNAMNLFPLASGTKLRLVSQSAPGSHRLDDLGIPQIHRSPIKARCSVWHPM